MADFTIYLGNKNYSSWSLRPWLVLKQTGVPFDEVVIPLYEATSKATIMKNRVRLCFFENIAFYSISIVAA